MTVPVVEPRVNAEKLAELLVEGHESESLDYKLLLDLDDRQHIVELAKDVAAMQVRGGFIVVGVAEDGAPSGNLNARMAALFDEATIRGKLRRYMSEPIDIRVGVHDLEGNRVAVLYVGPNPAGFCVMRADGALPDNRLVFRAGDVFTRHGSASERWSQEDIAQIMDRLVAREKDRWRQEVGDVVAAQVAAGQAQQHLAGGPLAAVTWQLDEATYQGALAELLRRSDAVGRRALEAGLTRAIRELIDDTDRQDDLAVALDRAASHVATAVALGEGDDVDAAARFLVTLYDLGDNERLRRPPAAGLWYAILQRLEAAGALAVRLQRWDLLPTLVMQRGAHRDFGRYPNWLVHAGYAAGNAGLMEEVREGRRLTTPLLRVASAWVARTGIARPDLPDDVEAEEIADVILDSLCQFDFLACVVSAGASGRADWTTVYPHFGRFYSHRTTPVADRLLDDARLRETLFPLSDAVLAAALANINVMAGRVSQHAGWDGFSDRVDRFIARHLPADTPPADL